jgi:hypothetical protein
MVLNVDWSLIFVFDDKLEKATLIHFSIDLVMMGFE